MHTFTLNTFKYILLHSADFNFKYYTYILFLYRFASEESINSFSSSLSINIQN